MIFAVLPVVGHSRNSPAHSQAPRIVQAWSSWKRRDPWRTTTPTYLHLLSPGVANRARRNPDPPAARRLSVEEVARSFLVTEAAMAKRLVPNQVKIKAGQDPVSSAEPGTDREGPPVS